MQILDRDRLPRGAGPRCGAPQASQSHILLTPGCAALTELLPGAVAELTALGAAYSRTIHIGADPRLGCFDGPVLAVGREFLEDVLRRQVGRLRGVQMRGCTSVLDVRIAANRVVGVRANTLANGRVEDLDADLVIDASGRTSHLVDTLAAAGLPVPAVDRLRIDGRYATRRFTLAPGRAVPAPLDDVALIVQHDPGVAHRAAVICRVAARSWSVSMAGYRGHRAPPELPGFRDFARDLPGPIVPLLGQLLPEGEAATFRLPSFVRRRFEDLPAAPMALVVVGDARCCADDAGGIGMSLAAIQALALRHALDSVPLADAPRETYRRTARLVDEAWVRAVRRHTPLRD